jgi:hypothetical protein
MYGAQIPLTEYILLRLLTGPPADNEVADSPVQRVGYFCFRMVWIAMLTASLFLHGD